MDNAIVIAGHGRMATRRLMVRLSVMAVSVSLLFAAAMVIFERQADAQIPGNFLQSIVCPILLNLSGIFGGLFAGLFNALLSAFGCGISG